ncbi:hypothetical protein PZ897_16485 [Hoeflea sp. YIM 152468]|uniref:hypothetical protein n=1 Tax=Hoeflea sp. YIM 152468 TaxID=3031759 RepID=UPI0023DC3938|nr:hypothetical protein [Hoeflea sp. YIM 152468]MDF1609786.1 hypothetical protein [Hoeflea sp. YIM 152468]
MMNSALPTHDGMVAALSLRPGGRGEGIGKVRLDAARTAHRDALDLSVFERNAAALRFCKRKGLRDAPTRRGDTTEKRIATRGPCWRGGVQ